MRGHLVPEIAVALQTRLWDTGFYNEIEHLFNVDWSLLTDSQSA